MQPGFPGSNLLSTSNLLDSIQNPLAPNIDSAPQQSIGVSHSIGTLAQNHISISSKQNAYVNKKPGLGSNIGTLTTKNVSLGVNLSNHTSSKPSLQITKQHNMVSAARSHLSSSGINNIGTRIGETEGTEYNANLISSHLNNISNSSAHLDNQSFTPLNNNGAFTTNQGNSNSLMIPNQMNNQKYGNMLRFRNMPVTSEAGVRTKDSLGGPSTAS